MPRNFCPATLAQQILRARRHARGRWRALREQLGLNGPRAGALLELAFRGALTGRFRRFASRNGRPISELIGARLGNTVFLALYAAALAVPISLVLGILAALWRNSIFDRVANAGALTAISFPEFFVAYILVLWLAQSGYFPSMVRINPTTDFGDRLYMTFLPALTLTLVVTAHMMRMTRAAIINLMASPYIEMARAQGPVAACGSCCATRCPTLWRPSSTLIALNLAYLNHRCRGGRGGLRLPRPRAADGRCRVEPRHRGGAGGGADLRRGLCRPQPHRGRAFGRSRTPRLMHRR